MEDLSKAKPNFPGSFHGQVHEVETEDGHRIVKFPIKKPDGSQEYGARKIPNKKKIVHVWDHSKKDWERRPDQWHLPGADTGSSHAKTAKTPMDAAKAKAEAHEQSKGTPKQESKPKTITRKQVKKSEEDMDNRLEQLEKALKQYKEILEKQMVASDLDSGASGSINTAAIAKAEDKKKKKHEDEKEDKQLIAEAIDLHNEKKHGEAKSKNSAQKDMDVEKADKLSKEEEKRSEHIVDHGESSLRYHGHLGEMGGHTYTIHNKKGQMTHMLHADDSGDFGGAGDFDHKDFAPLHDAALKHAKKLGFKKSTIKDMDLKKEEAKVAPEGSNNRESYQREFGKSEEILKTNELGQWSLEKSSKSSS